jgi:Fe-S oxidoreductase
MRAKGSKTFDLAAQGRICALCPNMCRFLCPVAAVEKLETVTPRGRATLVSALAADAMPLSGRNADAFYHCAQCKICREWCPSRVDPPEVAAAVRRRAAGAGAAPAAVRVLASRLAEDRSLYGRATTLADGLDRYRPLLGRRARILYFAGCATAALHPRIIEATLRLFEILDLEVGMLEPEECCGLPLDGLGYVEEAASFAGSLARAVADGGYETIVTGCPMCAQVMKERYPALGAPLAAGVRHVTEFLDGLREQGRLAAGGAPGGPAAGAYTYHDPCYLGRYQGLYEAPRRLLVEVAGLELIEMERNRELATCCGGALPLETAAPATATTLAARRLAEAGRTSAAILVTACPRCLGMFKAAAAGEGKTLPVRDISVVLAQSLGGGGDG